MRPTGVIEVQGRSEISRPALTPDFAWKVMAWVGLALMVVGGMDLALTLVPMRIGNPEWEFGTVSAILNGMPALTMGLALVLGGAAARGTRWLMRTMAVLLFVLSAVILVSLTLYALTVPLALRVTENPVILLGLKKAIAKTVVQGVVYPLTFTAMGIAAFRHSGRVS